MPDRGASWIRFSLAVRVGVLVTLVVFAVVFGVQGHWLAFAAVAFGCGVTVFSVWIRLRVLRWLRERQPRID